MSGKFEQKKQKAVRKKKSHKLLWILLMLSVLIFAAAVMLLLQPEDKMEPEITTAPAAMETTAPTERQIPTETGEPEPTEANYLLSVDQNIKITEIGGYTGAYMEDGSDEIVSDVLRITITNVGGDPLQYAKLTLGGDAGEAVFTLTTLMPGETMIVLETNRKTYTEGDAYTTVQADNMAYFQYEPSLQEDKLKIQPLDGGFNITNISDEDIAGKIVIYFKDYSDGVYYGGITYSGTIEGGMKAGEIKQIMSDNFSAAGTAVMFINIG